MQAPRAGRASADASCRPSIMPCLLAGGDRQTRPVRQRKSWHPDERCASSHSIRVSAECLPCSFINPVRARNCLPAQFGRT